MAHDPELRERVLDWMRETGRGYRAAASHFGVPVERVNAWQRRHIRDVPEVAPAVDRELVLAEMRSTGAGAKEIAARFGLRPETVRQWAHRQKLAEERGQALHGNAPKVPSLHAPPRGRPVPPPLGCPVTPAPRAGLPPPPWLTLDEEPRQPAAPSAAPVVSYVAYDAETRAFMVTAGAFRFELTGIELVDPTAFQARFVEAVGWVPKVPNSSDDWVDIVNGWLAAGRRLA